jgi:hypothetical protein
MYNYTMVPALKHMTFTATGTYLTLTTQLFGSNMGITNALDLPQIPAEQIVDPHKVNELKNYSISFLSTR